MSKVTIQIKNRWTGSILFEYSAENNTVKKTVKEAIKSRADLTGADLTGANLSRADLTGAYLTGSYLTGANLTGANLSRADLTGANLTGANLSRADLTGAYLTGANLTRADLTEANLTRADLTGADLTRADLTGADLTGADLTGVDLYGADLTEANLPRADLTGSNLTRADLTGAVNTELPIAQTRILPEGDIIGYKKTLEGVVKLLIPADAKRSHAFGRKCRAEFAKVIEMPEGVTVAHSSHDNSFEYRIGEVVKPKEPFSDNWQDECASGIHFFITRIEAENY